MSTYKSLGVWKESRTLYKMLYAAVKQLPDDEKYAMSSQMRRAVISISSNIAEGQGRGTIRDYIHFLYNSRGSAYELETQIIACGDLLLIDKATLKILYYQNKKVITLLNALIDSLESKAAPKNMQEEVAVYGNSNHENLSTLES
ncbi:MAG TPA: four helix bundle protein [Dialister sp.]|nr:four helix bundle protein [Dialister sp.]